MARQQTPAPEGGRITVLNAALADQIAAGEVVERPASVVKELVENAVDAGATRVDVELVDGGLTAIRVLDNGGGIHPDDLPVAIMRHGTSKIRGPEDLVEIVTLGFRGEALASMAAVAHLSLRSRQSGAEVGAEIRTVPGETPTPSPVGMPFGTQVEIRGLFANVPARRKFMRSEATEVGHCSETLLRIALVNPTVHLTLRHGRRELLNLAAGSLDVRVAQVLERRASGPFFSFSGDEDQIRVQGWLADPTRGGSGGRNGLYIVTRRRVVKERNISQILGQALGDLLTAKSPIGCLIVEPPPATVDVNVHPQKSEIRFSDPQRVYAAVRRILSAELIRAPWAPSVGAGPGDMSDPSPGADAPGSGGEERPSAGAAGSINRWAQARPEPEMPSLRGPEESSVEDKRGGGSKGRAYPGPAAPGRAAPGRAAPGRGRAGGGGGGDPGAARLSDSSYAERGLGPLTSTLKGGGAPSLSAARDAVITPAPSAEAGSGRGYRLGTRALDPSYGAHKREVRAAASELRGAREFEVPIASGPTRPVIGPLFAGVAMPVADTFDDGLDDDEEEGLEGLDGDDEVDSSAASPGAQGRAQPRLLTCLPGPVALYLDPATGDAEPTVLAIDLRALRSHLVFRRLMRDLKASQALAVQGLLQPVVVRRTADDVRLCGDAKGELLDLGIDLDVFGEDAVVVRGVPAHLRSCLDDADIIDLIARVIPWLRLRSSDRQRAQPQALLTAIAATAGPDPAPRLAKRWIAELIDGGESLDEVPGVRRWAAAELLGDGG